MNILNNINIRNKLIIESLIKNIEEKEKIRILASTEKDAKLFLNFLYSNNIFWIWENKPNKSTLWYIYKENTYYALLKDNFNSNTYYICYGNKNDYPLYKYYNIKDIFNRRL